MLWKWCIQRTSLLQGRERARLFSQQQFGNFSGHFSSPAWGKFCLLESFSLFDSSQVSIETANENRRKCGWKQHTSCPSIILVSFLCWSTSSSIDCNQEVVKHPRLLFASGNGILSWTLVAVFRLYWPRGQTDQRVVKRKFFQDHLKHDHNRKPPRDGTNQLFPYSMSSKSYCQLNSVHFYSSCRLLNMKFGWWIFDTQTAACPSRLPLVYSGKCVFKWNSHICKAWWPPSLSTPLGWTWLIQPWSANQWSFYGWSASQWSPGRDRGIPSAFLSF